MEKGTGFCPPCHWQPAWSHTGGQAARGSPCQDPWGRAEIPVLEMTASAAVGTKGLKSRLSDRELNQSLDVS